MAGTDVVSGCTPRNWPSMKAASTPSVMYDPSRLTTAVTLDDAMKSPAPITQPLGSEPPDGSSSPGQCTGDGEGEGEGEGGEGEGEGGGEGEGEGEGEGKGDGGWGGGGAGWGLGVRGKG